MKARKKTERRGPVGSENRCVGSHRLTGFRRRGATKGPVREHPQGTDGVRVPISTYMGAGTHPDAG